MYQLIINVKNSGNVKITTDENTMQNLLLMIQNALSRGDGTILLDNDDGEVRLAAVKQEIDKAGVLFDSVGANVVLIRKGVPENVEGMACFEDEIIFDSVQNALALHKNTCSVEGGCGECESCMNDLLYGANTDVVN